MRSAADGSGASGAIDPLAAVGRLLPSGVTNALGRRAVARPEDPRLVALPPQLAGQPQHLALHAAGHGQAVRADQPDPQRHAATVGDGTGAARVPGRGWHGVSPMRTWDPVGHDDA